MPETPVDLSPFRSLVNFYASGYVALVSHMAEARATTGGSGVNGRMAFVDPAIGEFGLSSDWELPHGADPALAYGYHVFAGNSLTSPFGSLNLVNIAKVIADDPDENRTHLVVDYVFRQFSGAANPGFLRCEVYRGPPLAAIIAHLDSGEIYNAIGSSYDTMRTAFQYRRDGVIGRLAEHEVAITTASTEQRMRIRIPVVGEDHTPAFELI